MRDDDDIFNTGFDPYEKLLVAEHNIAQLIKGHNENLHRITKLQQSYNHQQEVIKQLMFQNKKLQELITIHKSDITRLSTDLEFIKHKNLS